MAIESTREKIIFYALVPIFSAAVGALVTSMIQGQHCLPEGGMDLMAIIKDQKMSGPEKLKALEFYKEITGRPWDIVSSLMIVVALAGSSLAWALADWIRKR